jgi:hypothetical protein
MIHPGRLLVCAFALNLVAGVGAALAQTVIVRKAPPASTIELVLNGATVVSASADRTGEARLAVDLVKNTGKSQTDASVFIDVCDDVRKVVIVERGATPPPSGGCERRSVATLFLLRGITTIVLDLSGPGPTMRLRQGNPPDEWLRDPVGGQPRQPRYAPTGLILSAGGGLGSLRDAVTVSCGNVTPCTGDGSGFAYHLAAAVWIGSYVGVEATYVKPADATTSGSGASFRFDSNLDNRIGTLVAKVGAPIGSTRLYGQIGPTFHRATLRTSETFDATTVTINGVPTTIPGGTQTFELKTQGWTWTVGGGLEVWATRSFALFGEFATVGVKGKARGGGEGELDDRLTSVVFGVRVHIGRR